MRVFACCCFLLLSPLLCAESLLPAGCQPVAVQGESLTVAVEKNKLVFFHNLTNADLWLTHPSTKSGVSAGWTSRFQANNWSALVIDKGAFVLNCIESRPGHEQQVPCEGAVAVCQWQGAKIPAGSQGIFWAGEDLSLGALTAAIGARGFIVPQKAIR
ncbi:MAG: hypothetical protein ACHP65_09420 [Legionellales bacterium]